jgi:L-cysteine:1D-myo-inositol 2-amino-2-deoxy-alpha-D-glucopyranoside ligase
MESWRSPSIPIVPGHGPGLRLFDSATRMVRPVAPGAVARLYVCGITPYDATHLGHAFTYITFDLIQRVWLDDGHDVHYVSNVTDIDDPLLERAVALGEDWRDIARRETELFRTDMKALKILPPRDYRGAVESIPDIVEYILSLRDAGIVYAVEDDWYFDIGQVQRFGQVSGWSVDHMLEVFGERGGDPQRAGKRHPLDPLMWLAQRPDEPAWDTALGHGRPGWHIECVAIALDTLGMTFDIQGGGSDLIFPHHEMGAAHAEAITSSWPYARHYVHTGMVGYEGHKMSKSRGNLFFVSAARAQGNDPNVIRLALMQHHYRQDWEWQDSNFATAAMRLERWRHAARSGFTESASELVSRIRTHLADDLDTPSALLAIDWWAEQAAARKPGENHDGKTAGQAIEALLGIDVLGAAPIDISVA